LTTFAEGTVKIAPASYSPITLSILPVLFLGRHKNSFCKQEFQHGYTGKTHHVERRTCGAAKTQSVTCHDREGFIDHNMPVKVYQRIEDLEEQIKELEKEQ